MIDISRTAINEITALGGLPLRAAEVIPALRNALDAWEVKFTISPEEARVVQEVLAANIKTINETPDLVSILYDANLLPEQITRMRDAMSMAAVVEGYRIGVASQNQRSPDTTAGPMGV